MGFFVLKKQDESRVSQFEFPTPPNSMNPISVADILRQLKADLIGKDSYRGVTLTYAWMANQFGHYSLGFIPTLILYFYLRDNSSFAHPAFAAAWIVSQAWLLFELYNFLMPLLSKKKSKSKIVFMPSIRYNFEPAWGNVAFDTFTDLCFFWLGATSISLMLEFSLNLLYIVIGILLVLLYPTCYWYLTKIYVQSANYPFQFRLSQFDLTVSDHNKEKIRSFRENKIGPKHLFIFGSKKSGKTSLSVGISTEKSIDHETCVYTTGMKLFSMFFEPEAKLAEKKEQLWTWRNSSLLIIDDINPGTPIDDLVTP